MSIIDKVKRIVLGGSNERFENFDESMKELNAINDKIRKENEALLAGIARIKGLREYDELELVKRDIAIKNGTWKGDDVDSEEFSINAPSKQNKNKQ